MNSNSGKIDSTPSSEFQDNLNILRQIDLFSSLPLETAKLCAYLSRRETYDAGNLLFQQNEQDGDGYYIISGTTRAVFNDGRNSHIVREYRDGDFFGRLSILGNTRRLFSMEAVTDTTCLIISRHKFTKTMAQFPDLMPKLMDTVVTIIHQWEKQFLTRFDPSEEAVSQMLGVSLV